MFGPFLVYAVFLMLSSKDSEADFFPSCGREGRVEHVCIVSAMACLVQV